MPQTPPSTSIPEDTDMSDMAVRVFEMPLQLWRVMLGLMYFATKTQFWEASTATATPEECARAISKSLAEYEMNVIPTASILPFMGDTAPDGFLACDGMEYDSADYPRLAQILPTVFIVSPTRFTTPDLRNRFLSGTGDLATLGGISGANNLTLGNNHLPTHEHTYTSPISGATFIGEIPSVGVNGVLVSNTAPTGGGESFDNRPEHMRVNYIIRAR